MLQDSDEWVPVASASVSRLASHDEATMVYYHVLLVVQVRTPAATGRAPTCIRVYRTQWQPSFRILVVTDALLLFAVFVYLSLPQHEQPILLDSLGLELFYAHTARRQLATTDVRSHQAGVGVHLPRQQSQPQQLFVEPLEYLPEALVPHTLYEVADSGVIEHLVVYRQEAEPAKCQILRYCRAQSSE